MDKVTYVTKTHATCSLPLISDAEAEAALAKIGPEITERMNAILDAMTRAFMEPMPPMPPPETPVIAWEFGWKVGTGLYWKAPPFDLRNVYANPGI